MNSILGLPRSPQRRVVRIPAFGVFAGGGAKAAVFTGCLAAAEEWSIDFQGFGGSSGGAIVAALAAAGCSSEDIQKILLERDLKKAFLGDGGSKLDSMATLVRRLNAAVKITTGREWSQIPRQLVARLRLLWTVRKLLANFGSSLGLYSTDRIRDFVDQQLRGRTHVATYLEANNLPQVTFDVLRKATPKEAPCKFLKVLATDLHQQRPRIFGEDGNLAFDIATAVAASTSYPFLFRPVDIGGTLATDAGLSANLPIHLFEDERLDHRWPVIAFDLQPNAEALGNDPTLPDLAYRLLSTALEASEQPLREVLTSVIYIRVKLPKEVSTFAFGMTRAAKERLFRIGKEETHRQLELLVKEWKTLKSERELFHSFYAAPDAITPVLRTIADEFSRVTKTKDVRCHVMLPTPRDTRIIVYEHLVEGCSDYDIELALGDGVTGAAWTTRADRVGDLQAIRRGAREGVVAPHEYRKKIPDTRHTMLAVPIFNPKNKNGKLLGTLAVDTTTTPAEADWERIGKFSWDSASETAGHRLQMWAEVVGSLLD